jgi:hypothetical protein
LDREDLLQKGYEPADAMTEAAAWVAERAGKRRPVLVAYPAVFDWMFLYWYFVRFTGGCPFGVSGALDMKTMYQQKARVLIDDADRADLPPALQSSRPHTHNALDDALEQADVFARIYQWDGKTTSTRTWASA